MMTHLITTAKKNWRASRHNEQNNFINLCTQIMPHLVINKLPYTTQNYLSTHEIRTKQYCEKFQSSSTCSFVRIILYMARARTSACTHARLTRYYDNNYV